MSSFTEAFPLIMEPKIVTSLGFDNVNGCALDGDSLICNDAWISFVNGDGANDGSVAVIPFTSHGNDHAKRKGGRSQAMIKGHAAGSVKDISFNPFNKNQLLTCSTDASMRLWNIPAEGIVEDYTVAASTFVSKEKDPLRGVCPHHTIAGLVATRSSRRLHLWDLTSSTKGELVHSANIYNADLQSMCWMYGGEAIATTGKDKTLRLLDMRLSTQVVASAACHEGIRHSRVVQLGDKTLLTTGHGAGPLSKTRQVALWDVRMLDSTLDSSLASAVKTIEYDTGANYGNQLVPLYDGGGDETECGLIYVLPKGENNASIYQIAHGNIKLCNEKVGLGTVPTRGGCLVPRQALKHYDSELARVLQLSNSGIKALSVRSVEASTENRDPKREMYQSTIHGAPPSEDVTALSYMEGSNAKPNRIAITLTTAPSAPSPSTTSAPSKNDQKKVTESINKSELLGNGLRGDLDLDAEDRIREAIAAEEAAMAKKSAEAATALSALGLGTNNRQSQFRYMRCDEARTKDSYLDLRVSANPLLGDCPLLTASADFWAFPWEGTGGRVFVSDFSCPCKVAASPKSLLDCHAGAVSDLSFSPFHSELLATVGADSMLKIWQMPLKKGSNIGSSLDVLETWTDSDAILCKKLDSPVQTIVWHPVVPDIIACTTHENTIYVLSTKDGSVLFQYRIKTEAETSSIINNMSFHPKGTRIAVACKDNCVRIVDPSDPSNVKVSSIIGRNMRVVWCGSAEVGLNCLITVSAVGNNRVVSAWGEHRLDQPIARADVDAASGQLYPMYDSSAQLLFIVGKGDSTLRTYDLRICLSPDTSDTQVTLLKCADYSSAETQISWTGMCILPKQTCDIKAVQIARILKLTHNRMSPLSFVMPRSETQKAYFQDELYADIPTWYAADAHTVEDYRTYLKDGESGDDPTLLAPRMSSLCPEGMQKASVVALATKVETERGKSAGSGGAKVNAYKVAKIREEQEKKIKDDNFAKLQALAQQRASYHPNLSMGAGIGQDDDSSDSGWDD